MCSVAVYYYHVTTRETTWTRPKVADRMGTAAKHLAEALKQNATLETLNLTFNDFDASAEEQLRAAWRGAAGRLCL